MLGMTPVQLRRRFQRSAYPAPRDLIITVCVGRAAALIADGMKVEAAFSSVGFRHHTNFNRQFRRCFGVLPSNYRHRLALTRDWTTGTIGAVHAQVEAAGRAGPRPCT
ncbi:helix-turn-helix domain-containing protein [Mycolicibacterium sp.]|uniref:helix-turn-helix domain-containing protein n=1 Tax=Mycolicibacterium sp. TaxID=2320850 RepID=UPI0037C545F2